MNMNIPIMYMDIYTLLYQADNNISYIINKDIE